jgi:hypothetical protein
MTGFYYFLIILLKNLFFKKINVLGNQTLILYQKL